NLAVAVKRLSDNQWWNGAFSGANPTYYTAALVGADPYTWSVTPAGLGAALTSGTSYYVVSRSSDNAANFEFGALAVNIPAGVGITFTYIAIAPTATITLPLNNLPGITPPLNTIAGTANVTVGLSNVLIAVQSQINGQWMNSSNFGFTIAQSTPNFIPVTTLSPNATYWTFTAGGTLDGKLTGDAKYTLVAQATDLSNISQSVFVLNTSSFTILKDNVAPNAPLITFPANTQSYQPAAVGHIGNATQLRGTASDAGVNPSGIKGVGIRLSYLLATNTYYWTGTTFSSYTVTAATAWQTAGAAAWNYNNTIGSDITWPVDLSHAMKLEANATDFATLEDGTGSGNIGPITTINFNVDFVAPAGALTWPGANAAVSSAAVQMTGSETD